MTVHIDISPACPTLDTPLRITLSDLPPGGRVTVRSEQRDPRGGRWAAESVFLADAAGTVDLARDAPMGGHYEGVDPMGPVWSMRPLAPPAGGPADVLSPTELVLTALVAGAVVGRAAVRRRRIPDGLIRTEVGTPDGLVGILYQPAGVTGVGGVLLLAGAEGGLHEDDAALLADHGYAVLALAVYGVPGRPATMRDIPLEYFGTALAYLRSLPAVDPARTAVIGGSKGGEAALLIGAMYPEVAGVVSLVGSGVVTQGIDQSIFTGDFLEILRTPVPNWTLAGQPLPYVPNVVTPELEKRVADGAPVSMRMAFEPGLRLPILADATIAVEQINGPVLLVSGGDDRGCGPAYHQIAADRLAAHSRPHDHVVYPGAGHLIAAPPYAPTTVSVTPGPGVTFEHGGEPAATAHARADAWQRTLALLAAL